MSDCEHDWDNASCTKCDKICGHRLENGDSALRYNDETMSGINGWWDSVCERCGKVWRD